MSRNKRFIDLFCGQFNIIFETLNYIYRVEVSVKLVIQVWICNIQFYALKDVQAVEFSK